MNHSELSLIVDETKKAIDTLLTVKGGEYADSIDILANFKRGATLVGLQPLQVLLVYLSKHYDGFGSYVRKSSAGIPLSLSEPIEGRLDDIIVYCVLAKALIREAEQARIARRDPDQHGSGVPGQRTFGEIRPAAVGIPPLRE